MKTCITMIILLAPLTLVAQKDDNGQALLDRFFKVYESEGPAAAIRYGFGTNPWMEGSQEGIDNVIAKLEENIALLGDYIGYESIRSKQAGARFRAVNYFVYYDRQALRFSFQLYKNAQGWVLWNFRFDSDYDDELDEAMKLTDL